MRVLFTGGGTAGHLMPGIAVAEELRRQSPDVELLLVGSRKPLESELAAAAGLRHVGLAGRPLGGSLGQKAAAVVSNAAAYVAARRVIRRFRPDVAVGLGGYASAAAAFAVVHCRVPLLLLEQNAVPGRVTRWLAPRAAAVCLSFDAAAEQLPAGCLHVTGNPVRRSFLEAVAALPHRPQQIAVLGGSGGARTLNQCVPQALRILAGTRDCAIVHQSGEGGVDETSAAYRLAGLKADVRPFVTDVAATLARSSLAVSRAGGTTLAELAAVGVPAVLIPYPFAADDHQRRNAAAYASGGGAIVVDQRPEADFVDRLARSIEAALLLPPFQPHPHHRPGAAARIVDLLRAACGRAGSR